MERIENMDERAMSLVRKYENKIVNSPDFGGFVSSINVYIVWKCKVLQNWKWLISTNVKDGRYYEVTYNGDEKVFYFDVYKKELNKKIEFWVTDEDK